MIRTLATTLALSTVLGAASAQAGDIRSILAQQAESPAAPIPTTIPYSYTFSIEATSIKGDKSEEVQAVLRVDPSQPAGSRAEIISTSNPESEFLTELIEEFEDPEKTMEEQSDGFWCGRPDMSPSKATAKDDTPDTETSETEVSEVVVSETDGSEATGSDNADAETGPADFEILLEIPAEAVVRPNGQKLAELMMDSNENADKNGRMVMRKIADRVDGYVILAKPDAQMKGFKFYMTRPLTMMVVAKLKKMDMEQSCALAPNGFYHMAELKVFVDGKAMGTAFGQDMTMKISDLTPLP